VRQDLVCAACGGRVVEARCATCRHSRELLRQQDRLPAGAVLLLALLVLLLALALR
jgi:hypothetical protein